MYHYAEVSIELGIDDLVIPANTHVNGPVAQRIRHLTTDQGIPGSNPGWVKLSFFFVSHFRDKYLVK